MPFRIERPRTREEWLELRNSGVGGSDVAAIMGLSPWTGPYTIWAEKLGYEKPDDISGKARVEWGRRLEATIFSKFSDAHPELACTHNDSGLMFRSTERPWAIATLDGWAEVEGEEPCVVEVKTAHWPTSKQWDGGVPAHYLAQVYHYLSVTGWGRAYVAVLIDGFEYREYEVERDDADVEAVVDAVDAFWRENVEGDVPPDSVAAADLPAVRAVNDVGRRDYLDGDRELLELCEEWNDAKADSKRVKAREEELRANICARIGDAVGARFDEGTITWTRGSSKRFSVPALKEAEPEVYRRYLRPSPYSRLVWRES